MLDTALKLNGDMNNIKELLNKMKMDEFNVSVNVKPSESMDIYTILRCFQILSESIKKGKKAFEEIKKRWKTMDGD